MILLDYSTTTPRCTGWGVGYYPHRMGGGGWIDRSFFVFLKLFIEDHFHTHTSVSEICKIYSIDTFLKITIHSIHSIHHIVENIDIVRVLAVYSSGDRCLKVDGFNLFLRGFTLPHTHAVFALWAKVRIYTQMFTRF